MASQDERKATYAEYVIVDNSRRVAEISALLGLQPTFAHDVGDTYEFYQGINGPMIGVRALCCWYYSTVGLVEGDEMDPHLEFLLAALEPCAAQIAMILQTPGARATLWIRHAEEGRFAISSPVLARIAKLTSWISVTPEFDQPGDEPEIATQPRT